MVMELASGGELYERIVEWGCYGELDAVATIRMILEGLAYLHKCRVTHRDLKPENLLYLNADPDARLLITDFGLAHWQQNGHQSGAEAPDINQDSDCQGRS